MIAPLLSFVVGCMIGLLGLIAVWHYRYKATRWERREHKHSILWRLNRRRALFCDDLECVCDECRTDGCPCAARNRQEQP